MHQELPNSKGRITEKLYFTQCMLYMIQYGNCNNYQNDYTYHMSVMVMVFFLPHTAHHCGLAFMVTMKSHMIYLLQNTKDDLLMTGTLIKVSKFFIQERCFDVQPLMDLFLVNTYRKLICHLHLSGYSHYQYSDYCHPNLSPVAVWMEHPHR